MATVSGLFDDYHDASQAVRELHAAGIANADISLVTADLGAAEAPKPSHTAADVAGGVEAGAGAGVVLGGAGGLLAGVGLLTIPGIGPAIAGGWLLATAVGAAAGAVLGGAGGGIIGALIAGGVPENHAHVYSEGLRRGGTLVTVKTEDAKVDQARAILDDNDAIDVSERKAAYEGEGWRGFDETAAPLTTTKQASRDGAVRPSM